jgi:hypothetical protein
MSNYTQSAIVWPEHFLPGTTDNFVSNEVIVKGVSVTQIWTLLADTSKWESYYKNCAQVAPPSGSAVLARGAVFKFSTFGFPQLTCTVEECVPASASQTGRLAWSSKTPDGLEIYHAWIVEGLEGQRVRILTQESQNGPVRGRTAVLWCYVCQMWANVGDRYLRSGRLLNPTRCCWAIRIGWMEL